MYNKPPPQMSPEQSYCTTIKGRLVTDTVFESGDEYLLGRQKAKGGKTQAIWLTRRQAKSQQRVGCREISCMCIAGQEMLFL
jgi:hypothetical protein